MSERLVRVALPAAIIVLLAAVVAADPDIGLDVAEADSSAADGLLAVVEELPSDADVVIGFDPDVGTYAEVRPTVRALLADLVDRRARLHFISLTPEGRALATAEMARLDLGAEIVDLGFVPGSEAALVELAGNLGGEMDLAVVIGGNDFGPRSWVEQVATRVADLPLIAITPAVLLPEVEPYRTSGQLVALLTTPRQGAAYRDMIAPGAVAGPSDTAVAVGLLVAIAWLAAGLAAGIRPGLRSLRAPVDR